MFKNQKLIIIFILVTLGVATRLLPHWWNFTPIAAIALFAGVYFNWRTAVILPLSAIFLSDLFIGFYALPIMISVYGSFILTGLIGSLVKRQKSFEVILAATIFSSVLFYLITNYAVWQFSPWYEKSLAGLGQSYYLALPFFRASLIGDLFYTGVLFGSYELVSWLVFKRKKLEFLRKNC